MREVSAKRMPAPIKIQINGHSFLLTMEEAAHLRNRIAGILRNTTEENALVRLLQICANHFNVSIQRFKCRTRAHVVAYPRQAFMWLAHHGAFSHSAIARHLEMNHASVMHGIAAVQRRIETEPRWKVTMSNLYVAAEKEADVRMLVPAKGLE